MFVSVCLICYLVIVAALVLFCLVCSIGSVIVYLHLLGVVVLGVYVCIEELCLCRRFLIVGRSDIVSF